MKLEFGFPNDIERARKNNTPLVIPVGTMEYHGAHVAYGCDTLIVTGLLERLAKKKDILIAPPIWYSPSSFAVADETSGTVHVEEDVFEKYVYYVLKSYLDCGLTNIYLVIHHQYEDETLMPLTLCCKKAAKVLLMRRMEETRGKAWWGSDDFRNYYDALGTSGNPLDYIKVIPAMSARAQRATGYDHAGKYETSLLMALCPDAVRMDSVKENRHWYTEAAGEASVALGEQMAKESLKDLAERIR